MSRRLLAVLAAIVLALVGGGLVISVTRSADQRAVAQLDPVEVLVVGDQEIPAGTPAEDLGQLVERRSIPGTAAVPGRLTTLSEAEGRVTSTALQPGEQLLGSRFVAPEALEEAADPTLPEDKHEVTIPLEGHRALGGRIAPGETVGVVLSFDGDPRTHLELHKVLVTSVQGAPMPLPAPEPTTAPEADPAAAEGEPSAPAADPVPQNALLISLAVSTADVEEIVHAAEFGTIWLTREGEAVPNDPTGVVTNDRFWPADAGSTGAGE